VHQKNGSRADFRFLVLSLKQIREPSRDPDERVTLTAYDCQQMNLMAIELSEL